MQRVRYDSPMQLTQARLKGCQKCDQNIAGQCTMTAELVAAMTSQPERNCPQGLWPGEVPHKWLPSTIQRVCVTSENLRVLFQFPHGMGDHLQLTTLLLHLHEYRPRLVVDVACRAGCESLFVSLCHRVWRIGEPISSQFDTVIPLQWYEVGETYVDSPSTKVERCLRHVFRIQPDPGLCRYVCHMSDQDQTAASDYLQRMNAVGRAVLIHPRGRCGSTMKDLSNSAVKWAVETIRQLGAVPIVLDWDGHLNHADWGSAINAGSDSQLWPQRVGEAGRLAALAQQSRLCIGIDSGPGHVFGAVTTPTLIYWKHLHPINYFGLADNVTHLVPAGHGRYIRGDRAIGEKYFQDHYHHRVYTSLELDLGQIIREKLTDAA